MPTKKPDSRPFLAACLALALRLSREGDDPQTPADLEEGAAYLASLFWEAASHEEGENREQQENTAALFEDGQSTTAQVAAANRGGHYDAAWLLDPGACLDGAASWVWDAAWLVLENDDPNEDAKDAAVQEARGYLDQDKEPRWVWVRPGAVLPPLPKDEAAEWEAACLDFAGCLGEAAQERGWSPLGLAALVAHAEAKEPGLVPDPAATLAHAQERALALVSDPGEVAEWRAAFGVSPEAEAAAFVVLAEAAEETAAAVADHAEGDEQRRAAALALARFRSLLDVPSNPQEG